MSTEAAPSLADLTPADTPPASDPPAGTGEVSHPDWLAEKFRGAENPVEAQAKAYGEAVRALTRKTEDLRGELRTEVEAELRAAAGVPEDLAGYALPEGFEDDDRAAAFREAAKAAGMSPAQFEAMAKLYETMLPAAPDLDAERAKLGEKAEARIGAVNAWGSKNIPPRLHDAAKRLMQTAEGFELFETMMKAGTRSLLPDPGAVDPPPAAPTREKLQEMMRDDRYRDPRKREASYVREVEAYAGLLAKQNAAG